MKHRGRRCRARWAGLGAALWLALPWPTAAWAAEATSPVGLSAQAVAQERAAIAEHRRLMLKILADEEAACSERFAVTACLDDVRRRRREALAPLRERELRLDESERRARAEERRRAVAAKQAAAAAPAPPVAPANGAAVPSGADGRAAAQAAPAIAASGPVIATPVPAAASRAAPVLRVRRPLGPASAASAREAEAADRVRDAARRREQTEAVRERIERRQAEREAAGRRGDPLPRPGAASQAAR